MKAIFSTIIFFVILFGLQGCCGANYTEYYYNKYYDYSAYEMDKASYYNQGGYNGFSNGNYYNPETSHNMWCTPGLIVN